MKNQTKTLEVTYLYSDGHAVQVYSKEDRDAGEIKFVEIHEKFTDAQLDFNGRIVFGRYRDGMAQLVQMAERIDADQAKLANGSENTRKLGIAVGSLDIHLSRGVLHFTDMPDLISGVYTYQPETDEEFKPDLTRWCDYRVSKIHRVKAQAAKGGAL